MARSQTLKLTLALIILALATVGIIAASASARAETPEAPTIPTWPSFTMLYVADGVVYSIGDSPAVTTREVRRLDYTSPSQWTDTVVEAPSIDTPVGTDTRVGFITQLKGNSYTESNSSGEITHTDTAEDDTTILVSGVPAPFPIEASGVTTTVTSTTAKVCFLDECTENAAGRLYRKPNGNEFVYVDDARGIPLRMGETFVVREIRIKSARQAITQ